jgi:hypothetical protein
MEANSMVFAAFDLTGKTTFANLYPHKIVEFADMPIHSNADEELAKINEASEKASLEEKILIVPAMTHILHFLQKADIQYMLYYPHKDAMEIYREKFVRERGTDNSTFDIYWDRYMNILENDPCESHTVLKPHEYLSDTISILDIAIISSPNGYVINIENALIEECSDEVEQEGSQGDAEELGFTYSIGPEPDEPIQFGSKLSEVSKTFSNGPEPPEDEKYINVANISIINMITRTEALATLSRLGLLGRYLTVPDWKLKEPDEVRAFMHNRKLGISIKDNTITFGDEPIEQESMEVLCQLDLLDKPISGWKEENE